MQVDRDNMVVAGSLQHVGDELRADRRPALVLLVLSCVGKVQDDSSDMSH